MHKVSSPQVKVDFDIEVEPYRLASHAHSRRFTNTNINNGINNVCAHASVIFRKRRTRTRIRVSVVCNNNHANINWYCARLWILIRSSIMKHGFCHTSTTIQFVHIDDNVDLSGVMLRITRSTYILLFAYKSYTTIHYNKIFFFSSRYFSVDTTRHTRLWSMLFAFRPFLCVSNIC